LRYSLDSVSGKRPDWIASKKVTILFPGRRRPLYPQLKDVPFVPDLAPNPVRPAGDRISLCRPGHRRPFWLRPIMPADRMKMVRRCLPGHHENPEFIEDARRNMLAVEPEDGEHLTALIQKVYATPKLDRGQGRRADQSS